MNSAETAAYNAAQAAKAAPAQAAASTQVGRGVSPRTHIAPPSAPAAPAPVAAAPAQPGQISPQVANYVKSTWGPKWDALKQQQSAITQQSQAIRAEVDKLLAMPPDQQAAVAGQQPPAAAPANTPAGAVASITGGGGVAPATAPVAPPTGNDRFSQAVAADHANQPAPYVQPKSIKNANWTPEQIAASQATANSPQAQAARQAKQDAANPWAARSNNPTYTRTPQAAKPAYEDPDKIIRDAKVKKGFSDIDAKYAGRAKARAAKGGEYAKVDQELAGKTPAQRREIYKKWDREKK